MLNSVMRTGTMRFLLQTNSVSGACIGAISSVPGCASALFACKLARARIDDRLRARRAAAECRAATAFGFWSGNSSWSVASISASSLIVSTGGPFSRSASERSPLSAPTPLHLQAARERIGVVLQRDDALDRAAVWIEQHEPAFQEAR